METDKAINLIFDEYKKAYEKHPKFPTIHHGYAVILEEVDELWEEIKKKNPDIEEIRKEVIQVGAMALRFLIDLE